MQRHATLGGGTRLRVAGVISQQYHEHMRNGVDFGSNVFDPFQEMRGSPKEHDAGGSCYCMLEIEVQ